MTSARIVGSAETDYQRHPPSTATTSDTLATAAKLSVDDAGLTASDIDGLGVASFTLAPDTAIDLAVRLGLRLSWLMDARTGGASGVDMLQHAARALEAGDATNVLLLAGDVFQPGSFRDLVDNYNVATREHLAGVPFGGPNSLFALVTTRHMRRFGLAREDYGRLVIAQRRSAASNPNAAYRAPLEIEDYLGAEIVADPLCLLDCPPVVSGANGLVLSLSDKGVRIRSIRALHNHDQHESDGTVTGLAELADHLWGEANAGPAEMDLALVYDDYPVMALAQLTDLGFGTPQETLAAIDAGSLRVNTSGGQLSAGQAGAAGGLHHLVEAVRQLGGTAGDRQVPGAKLAVVTGYGMVSYRYGACANATVLEAS